jgi:arylsulfatase A-like enzyme
MASAGVSDALTQTIDIAPSILERAGIKAYNGIQGQSLLPLMQGATPMLRDSLMIEEEGQRSYLSFDTRVRVRTIVTKSTGCLYTTACLGASSTTSKKIRTN